MKTRLVITTADSILHVLRQYLQGLVPNDAQPHRVLVHPSNGRVRVEYLTNEKPQRPVIEARFTLKRTF